MGTRNLTCTTRNGEFLLAQYGQWDGYPSGNGIIVLEFLRDNSDNATKFLEHLENATFPTYEDIHDFYITAGQDPNNDSGFVNSLIADKFAEAHGSLSRDMGASVLEYVLSTATPELRLSQDFAQNSTFCEYAYNINLDTHQLEVYGGYDMTPANVEGVFGKEGIQCIQAWDLENLPTNEEFLGILEPNED